MKKLMIAVAAVAMAVAANAATTKWAYSSTAPLKDGYGKAADSSYTPVAMSGATLYLFCVETGVSQDDLLKAVRGGASLTDYALKDSSGNIVSGTTDSAGKITTANAVVFSSTAFDTTSTYNFYSAILVDDYLYLTASKPLTANDNPDLAKQLQPAASTSANLIDKTGTASFSSGGWYSTVPEPTSGLLLLLGVAGLALRRRRA